MKKRKYYYNTFFAVNVVEEAYNLFLAKLNQDTDAGKPYEMIVSIGNESWSFDTREEFLAEYPKSDTFRFDHISQDNRIIVEGSYGTNTSVIVSLSSRRDVEDVFRVFERHLDASKMVVETEPVKVFIGHGRAPQWRDLKDHLHDQHGLEVVAYEIGPRAGLSIKEVLEDMLNKSSFALLVLTGEDEHADGEIHARENVIHELGLFQGNIGFTRAIALLEEGVKEFSNILGINQIRFSKGNIREVYGDVIASMRREFEAEKD
jgi:predicted nucleotide-binding protein